MPSSTPWTKCHRASPARVRASHLAKAMVFVQRGRIEDARAEITARALADLLPESDKARFDDRTALVELFCIGSDLGWGAAVGSGAALLERFDRSEQRPDPAVRASVQMFVGMAEARLENHVGLTLEMLRPRPPQRTTVDCSLELTALAESCIPAIAEGRLSEVRDVAVEVLARAHEQGWVGLVTLAPAVTYLGWFDYWRGNLREARAQLERSLSMMVPFDWERGGSPWMSSPRPASRWAISGARGALRRRSGPWSILGARPPRGRPCWRGSRGWFSWPRENP